MEERKVFFRLNDAVRYGELERAEELINTYGLSYCKPWSDGYILIRDALCHGQKEIAKLLLRKGARVTCKNPCSTTPLHNAATVGDVEIVEMILARGANIDAKNKTGETPLHYAIDNRKIDVTKYFLDHGAWVNVRDNDGTSLLHLAVERYCPEIVEILLNFGADIDYVRKKEIKWQTDAPLHIAVEKNLPKIFELLLRSGANVNIKRGDGFNSLHLAAKNGYCSFVEDLLNHGADIDVFTSEGLTPLSIATKNGHSSVVELLLQRGANVNTQDNNCRTILHHAVVIGCFAIVETVLKYSPDLSCNKDEGLLRLAVEGRRDKYYMIVDALLKYGLTLNYEDANHPQLLEAAVEKGYLKIVEVLLKYSDNVNLMENTDEERYSPLLLSAVKNKHDEVAELFIDKANVNSQDKEGKLPIFYAVNNADIKSTKLLLNHGAVVKDDYWLLHLAVQKKSLGILKALLQQNLDINAVDKLGRTALHYTTPSSDEKLFNLVTSKRANDEKDDTEKIVALLLNKGANVNAKTSTGCTSLFTAISFGNDKVVEQLLAHNATVNIVANDDVTPLHVCAASGNVEVCKMLLNKGAILNAQEKNGLTALHIASNNGHSELVKVLLESGANVDCKCKSGSTPLFGAAEAGHQEVVNTIIKYGGDLNSRDDLGRTALHIATTANHLTIIKTLLEYGSDLNIVCKNGGLTALCYVRSSLRMFDKYNIYGGISCYEETAFIFSQHIIKMRAANLYVCNQNINSLETCEHYCSSWPESDLSRQCEFEVEDLKREKINGTDVLFYDILTKSNNSLAKYMENETIVSVLKSGDYKKIFPVYADLIQVQFQNGMKKKKLLEIGILYLDSLFTHFDCHLPLDCTEKIFGYVSDADLKNFINSCKSLDVPTSI